MIIDGGKPKDFDTDLWSSATVCMSRMLCLRIEIGLHIMKARILKQSSGREKECMLEHLWIQIGMGEDVGYGP